MRYVIPNRKVDPVVLEEELRRTAVAIDSATTAVEVVGPDDDGRKAHLRMITKRIHPDRWTDPKLRAIAQGAFARLQELLELEARAASLSFDVTTKKRTYLVKDLAFRGTVANLYDCTYSRDGELKTGLLKLPRSVHDNDLIQAEAQSLKKIWATGRRRTAFFPRIEDVFKHRDRASHVDRQAIVTRRLDGFISLEHVKHALPDGLDARDLAWVWRRCLAAASLLAELDIVHGSLIPAHILIHPIEHGVQFCGFTTSVPAGGIIKVSGGGSTQFYPPEVRAKEEATHATDLYTLHRTMDYMLRYDAPRQFRSFVAGVAFDRPAVRPQDSKALLGEFDELLERLYGPRRFREFPPMPAVTT